MELTKEKDKERIRWQRARKRKWRRGLKSTLKAGASLDSGGGVSAEAQAGSHGKIMDYNVVLRTLG